MAAVPMAMPMPMPMPAPAAPQLPSQVVPRPFMCGQESKIFRDACSPHHIEEEKKEQRKRNSSLMLLAPAEGGQGAGGWVIEVTGPNQVNQPRDCH